MGNKEYMKTHNEKCLGCNPINPAGGDTNCQYCNIGIKPRKRLNRNIHLTVPIEDINALLIERGCTVNAKNRNAVIENATNNLQATIESWLFSEDDLLTEGIE